MTVRVGINGFGRIGRNFFRAVLASGADIEIVAVNDLTDNTTLAHLLKYDSILGRLADDVDRHRRRASPSAARPSRSSPSATRPQLPWGDLGADVVIESTGFFTDADQGARRTSTAAPRRSSSRRRPRTRTSPSSWASTTSDYDPATHTIISNASCTTNCLAPMAKVAQRRRSASSKGLMTTIHAYTQRPEPAGRPAQGPAPRPRRRAQHRADLDRCRQGDRPGAARAQGQARRLRAAGAGADRLGHRPHLRRPAARPRVEEVNAAVKAAAEGPLKGYPEVHRGPDRLHRHRHRPGVVHLRRRPDQGHRQPGQGRRLVRQRVGLLQPPRRPGHATSARAL